MGFDALEISLQVVRALRPVIQKIARSDKSLADQIDRASSGVPLGLAEGAQRRGKDQQHDWRVAQGSASEAKTGVRVAEAKGLVAEAELPLALLDRQSAVLFRLTYPWPKP